ncbi:MAG: tRNA (adenosine(37)-N6)-threonylcarbamoyltransferase complex dimerization subunit type 1 TsaB [Oscillospiraceae bacterium]|nr:tRNA (adenosine(37)-N6)-threonylcarbamoyltransferase complex dimerization subunit type 1 TsaB [Oscillospiraceae bacterium]
MILGIDTGGKTCSVALLDDVLLGEYSVYSAKTHSQTLMPMIEKLINDCGKSLKDIKKIAVSIGPGSYTGLRIGISSAKGLAFGLGINCISVPALTALTYNVNIKAVAIMKARANLVYSTGATENDCIIDKEELFEKIKAIQENSDIYLVGDGAKEFYEQYPLENLHLAPDHLLLQKASSVCYCAKINEERDTVSPFELKPVYLQEFKLG